MSLKHRLRGRSHGPDGIKASDRIRELEETVKNLEVQRDFFIRRLSDYREMLDKLGGMTNGRKCT